MNQNFNAVPGTCTRFKNEAEFSSLRYLCVIREANFRGVVLYCLARGGTKGESCTHTLHLQFKTRPRLRSTIISWKYPRTGLARQYFPGQPQMMLYNTNEAS